MQPDENAVYVLKLYPGLAKGEIGRRLVSGVRAWPKVGAYPASVSFYDQERVRNVPVEVFEEEGSGFRLTDRMGRIWHFEKVTMEEFRSRISKHMPEASIRTTEKEIKTTKDLWNHIRKTYPL